MHKKAAIIQLLSFFCLILYLSYYPGIFILLIAGVAGLIISLFLSNQKSSNQRMLAISSSIIFLLLLCYYYVISI